MPPDEFMALVEGGQVELGTTDKSYKVYVKNSTSGKTSKFYFQHLSIEQRKRFVEFMNEKRLRFEGGIGFYVRPFFVAPREGAAL
jgi:hypothetical protein